MKIDKYLILITLFAFLFSCESIKEVKEASYNTVPLPSEISKTNSDAFKLNSSTKIVFPEGNDKMKRNAEFLSEYLMMSVGVKPDITSSIHDNNIILLSLDLDNDNEEAYRINVNENAISISGSSEAGVFYGIQTLRKATPVGKYAVSYPAVTINDEPRFGYRGTMLDIARHFQSVEFVKKFIDMIALHNINRFHWHLTEDQGWRIEIKKYPRLTEVGSMRSETVIGQNTGEYDGIPHGGFYTQAEIKDIVNYAAERYITVIPEIDLPGHMLAALTAYPELGCTGGPYEVERTWGVFDDVLCPGKEHTFTFLEDVLTEVMELFPSKYIHIGGDECPKVRWEECPDCQNRIKELGLKDAEHKKEFYLQSYVTARVEKFLNDHGRSIIGWDEILEGELAPNATVMSWRGMQGGIEAAKMNHDVIMTPTTYCYFDYYQTQFIDDEPFGIGGYVPVELVYSFEPAPDILTKEQKQHILGAQANLWTEYIKTSEHVEYMLLPRLAALSEVQWMQPDKKDYDEFLTRLPQLTLLYDKLNYNYATHVFDVHPLLTANFDNNSLDVSLSTIDNSPIYYTLDGTNPDENSNQYSEVLSIKESTELKAVSIRENGSKSKLYSESVKVNKSTFKPTKLLTKPAGGYEFSGAGMLVDGLFGANTNYKTGKWIGFQGNDLIVVIDMQESTEISSLSINNAVITGDWIFDTSEIIIEASDVDSNYSIIKAESFDSDKDHRAEISEHKVEFEPVTAQYFKVTVKTSVMPDWHPGKGRRAFIFVDEIVLN